MAKTSKKLDLIEKEQAFNKVLRSRKFRPLLMVELMGNGYVQIADEVRRCRKGVKLVRHKVQGKGSTETASLLIALGKVLGVHLVESLEPDPGAEIEVS